MASSTKVDVKVAKMLEKLIQLKKQRSSAKYNPDDLSQYRHVTLKLLQQVQALDRSGRDSLLQDPVNLDSILATLEFADRQVMMNIVNVCLELIGKTNTGKRAVHFVSSGTQALIFTMTREFHESSPADDLLVAIHQLLAKIAPKDKKFSVKLRLGQGLPVLLYLLRNNCSAAKNIHPVLQLLKIVSANSVNASYLGKNGAVTYLYKVMVSCGKRRLTAQKMALDSLALLLKSKSNSARAVGQGLVPYLLTQFQEWHRLDTKHKHVSIRKAILAVLKNITNLKSGRKAMLDTDGVRILYNTCKELLDVRDLENLVMVASAIMRKCFPKCRLPLANLQFLTFPLPESDFNILDWCSTRSSLKRDSAVTIDDANDDSSVDDDDDVSSEDEVTECRTKMSAIPEDPKIPREAAPTRSPDDLFMYQKYFAEQFDIVLPPDCSPEIEPTRDTTHTFSAIYVPSVESASDSSVTRRWSAQLSRPSLYRSFTEVSDSRRSGAGHVFHAEVNNSVPINRTRQTTNICLSKPNVTIEPCDLFVKGRTFEVPIQSSPSDTEVRSRRRTLETDRPTPTSPGDKYSNIYERTDIYQEIALRTRSVLPFSKIAYPEMNGHKPTPFLPALYKRKFSVLRNKTYSDICRWLNPEEFPERVVYELDNYLCDLQTEDSGAQLAGLGPLKFNSRFESGNLRKAIQVNTYEYDLLLNPDVNTDYHHQWFYFEVSNTQVEVNYRFNIINCEKNNSQFNFGMKPVMFSQKEAMYGRAYWLRAGTEICYYKNHYRRCASPGGPNTSLTSAPRTHYTASFCMRFPHNGDVCYIAYHFPYTYSTLQAHLWRLETSLNESSVYYRNQVLCETLGGNEVPLLTITAYPRSDCRDDVEEMRNRPYIFLSARVHPGESNASWVMKGTIQFLLSEHPSALALRNMYIFKIVPMLNPDGVINGNDRCSLSGEDLNRRWYSPCPILHPTIYHTKGLLQYMKLMAKTPAVFCDYHGHSRKKNVFMYGCSALDSWLNDDTDNPTYIDAHTEDESYKRLPQLLHRCAPSFALNGCSNLVEKSKEATARVVVWRQMRVVRSYTMESTFCGCQQGVYKGLQISTRELEEMGERFAEVLLKLKLSSSSGDNLPEPSGESDAASKMSLEGVGESFETASTASVTDDDRENDDDDDEDEEVLDDDDDDDDDGAYDYEECDGDNTGATVSKAAKFRH